MKSKKDQLLGIIDTKDLKFVNFLCYKIEYAMEHGSVMIDSMELKKFLKKPKVKKKTKVKG